MLQEFQLEYIGAFSAKWLFFAATVIFLAYYFVLFPAKFSSLSKIPTASPFAPLTSLWITWKRYKGVEFQTVDAAFRKHGPIVRIGPKELAINFLEGGIRTVYGRGYHKPSWYDHFINYGRRNIISTIGHSHGTIRRRISTVYAKSYLQNSPHFRTMMSTVLEERMAPILSQNCESKTAVDFLELSFAYGLDIMTATIFGLQCSTNLLQNVADREWLLGKFGEFHTFSKGFWLNDVPELTEYLAKMRLNPVSPHYYNSKRELEDWCLKLVRQSEDLMYSQQSSSTIAPGEKALVFEKMWHAVEEESKNEGVSLANSVSLSDPEDRRLEVASECLDHITATREDFGITLASIFYMISQHPESQLKLQRELKSVAGTGIPSPQTLESLPFFNAVIKESLRLRPNSPSPNPRLTPPNAASTIGSYKNIPPGTKIVAFSRCLHRNESVYTNADAFVPERWLRPEKLETAEEQEKSAKVDQCEQWYWPFSSGSRMCLASNMAVELIRMALAVVYLKFSTVIEDDSEFGIGGFVGGVEGEKLMIKLTMATN